MPRIPCNTTTECTCGLPWPNDAVADENDGCNFCGRATVPGYSWCIGAAVPECERRALHIMLRWQHNAELDYLASVS